VSEQKSNKETAGFERLLADFAGLINTYLKLFKLEVQEEIQQGGEKIQKRVKFKLLKGLVSAKTVFQNMLWMMASLLFIAILLLFFLIFFNIALSAWLNQLLQSTHLGFWLTAACNLLLVLLGYWLRFSFKKLTNHALDFIFLRTKNKSQLNGKQHRKRKKQVARSGKSIQIKS